MKLIVKKLDFFPICFELLFFFFFLFFMGLFPTVFALKNLNISVNIVKYLDFRVNLFSYYNC